MQLLEQLEPVGILELEVNTKHNDLQEGVENTPCLRLEHGRNEMSCGSECVSVCMGGGGYVQVGVHE